jgi:hypothetical protein
VIWVLISIGFLFIVGLVLHDAIQYEENNRKGTAHTHADAPSAIVPPNNEHATQERHRAAERSHWAHERRHNRVITAFSIVAAAAAVAAAVIASWAYVQTRRQADEAKRQADAAMDQILVAKDTEERQLRAYVVVRAQEKIDNFFVGGKAHVQGILDNVGQTPVYNSNVLSGVGVLDYPLKGPLAFAPCNLIMATPDARRHFFGKETYPGKDRDTPFTEEETTKIKGGSSAIYYYGKVCYTDIFQKVRHTEFCIFWNWSGNDISGAQYCEQGNTADEPENGPWPPTGPPQPPTSQK